MRVEAADPRPAQMVGDEQRLHRIDQSAQAAQIIGIEPIGGAQRHGHPMQRHRMAFAHPAQHIEGRPPSTMKFSEITSTKSTHRRFAIEKSP
jgi:hypothetical protein